MITLKCFVVSNTSNKHSLDVNSWLEVMRENIIINNYQEFNTLFNLNDLTRREWHSTLCSPWLDY